VGCFNIKMYDLLTCAFFHKYNVCRMTLWNDKYEMIKSPTENYVSDKCVAYLGKSQRGVYHASVSEGNTWPWLRVWLPDVSGSEMGWVLKSDVSLQMVENFTSAYTDMPWVVSEHKEHVRTAWVEEEEESEWDFESGIVLNEKSNDKTTTSGVEEEESEWYYKEVDFLGFHPYKEMVFLRVSSSRVVVSYHLNSSKVQELGILDAYHMDISIPYTPSWMKFASSSN
jgi:hypothetical protein